MKATLKRIENLYDIFVDELKDIYNAEEQICTGMPELIKAADNKDLKHSLQLHFDESKEHVRRLNKIFKILGIVPNEHVCEPVEQMILECKESIAEIPKSAVRDAAIIFKAQLIEHFEISVYGTLRTFAKELDLSEEIVDMLSATLKEEGNTDKTLTKIAEGGFLSSGINKKAAMEA